MDGEATFLWDGRSRPIGSSRPATRADGEATLSEGSTLILYTDGLVERRGESLDVGLERLRAAAQAVHGVSAQGVRDGLVGAMLPTGAQADDVAVVVLRLRRQPAATFERRFGAEVEHLRPLRRELGAWLDEHGVAPAARDAIVLSVWEAAVNAVEHGSTSAADPVTVRIRLEDGTLTAEVADAGAWRQRTPDPTRGNGLPLMRGSMDDVTVMTGEHGTTVTLRREVELSEVQ
jgi:anti-sigma regulatory factor (Ser/Thr protein kinase)